MFPGGVHERALKHLHAADILAFRHVAAMLAHGVNALRGAADIHDVFPCKDAVFQLLRTRALHRRSRDGQQHGRGRNLGDVVPVARVRTAVVAAQFRNIIADCLVPFSRVHRVPVHNIQHRDIGPTPDVQLNLLSLIACIFVIQAAAARTRLRPDLRDGNDVAPARQRAERLLPGTRFRVGLRCKQLNRFACRDIGIDRNRLARLGGNAERLEDAAALLIVLCVSSRVQPFQYNAVILLPCQQLLCKRKLIPVGIGVEVVVFVRVQQALDAGDLLCRRGVLKRRKGCR